LIVFDVYSLASDAAVAKFSNFFPQQQKNPKIPQIFPKICNIPEIPQKSSIFPKFLKNPQYSRNSSKIHKNPNNPEIPSKILIIPSCLLKNPVEYQPLDSNINIYIRFTKLKIIVFFKCILNYLQKKVFSPENWTKVEKCIFYTQLRDFPIFFAQDQIFKNSPDR
jgi:hypothetical protein